MANFAIYDPRGSYGQVLKRWLELKGHTVTHLALNDADARYLFSLTLQGVGMLQDSVHIIEASWSQKEAEMRRQVRYAGRGDDLPRCTGDTIASHLQPLGIKIIGISQYNDEDFGDVHIGILIGRYGEGRLACGYSLSPEGFFNQVTEAIERIGKGPDESEKAIQRCESRRPAVVESGR